MSKPALTLNIPEPCSEDLNAMTPTERGRFCAACQRDIFDFTAMSDMELYRVFRAAETAGGRTCGFFRPDQLGRKITAPMAPGSYPNTWRAMGLLMATWLSTQAAPAQEPVILGEVAAHTPVQVDTFPENDADWAERPRFIEGRVTDSEGKSALPYMAVWLDGTNIGTGSDSTGRFRLEVPDSLLDQKLILRAGRPDIEDAKFVISDPRNELPVSGLEIWVPMTCTIKSEPTAPRVIVAGMMIAYHERKPTFWQRLWRPFRK